MSSQIKDLWPESIKVKTDEIAPVTILKQQAAFLGKKTKNLVEAHVETRKTDYQRLLQHSFYLVAPALDFYKYILFRVEHHATSWYPLQITDLLTENGKASIEHVESNRQSRYEVGSEEKFIEKLKEIFASQETQRVIESLIAQSKA